MTLRGLTVGCGLALAIVACSDDPVEDASSGTALESTLQWSDGDSQLQIVLSRALGGDEQLHARVRPLADGETLDCAADSGDIPTFDDRQGDASYRGPEVQASMFEDATSPDTLLEETEASYAERTSKTFFVDVCVMDGSRVLHQARYDLRQARDRRGTTGKFDAFDDGVKITSNQAYAEACIADLGDIPFWGPRIGEDGAADWKTVDCTEIGTPIPSEVDGVPQTEQKTTLCDNPQYIYSHCEQDARVADNGPRVASARNDEGTHWVLLCRKSHKAAGRYEDMAMIGHNPFTGQTCFFQNQLPFGETPKPSNDGTRIPHPADNVTSESSPETWSSMWGGIQGGIGPSGGIQCQGCHSTDPFIHSPWIDGALREDKTPVVPKIGQHPDFVEGYSGPYRLLDAEDQGWNAPVHLVSEEAAACTRCHRIGLDQWSAPSGVTSRTVREVNNGGCVFCGQAPWLDRLEQKQPGWERLVTESHKTFANAFWMPPDAKDVLNAELWEASDYKKAMDFIRDCGARPDAEPCKWAALPKEPGDPAVLPVVEATGEDLAKKALRILGARHLDGADGEEVAGTRRCNECHSTSRVALRDWRSLTRSAISSGVDLRTNPEEITPERALEIIHYMRKSGEGSVFAAAKVGIFAPGVQFPWFQTLFQKAYGTAWGVHYGSFLQRVSMPKGAHPPLSAEEFAVVIKWFVDEELTSLDTLVKEIPPPADCADARERLEIAEGQVAPWFESHLEEMQFDGWGARNIEAGINMFGCVGEGADACFKDAANLNEFLPADAALSAIRIVEVKDLGFDTSFWMRSSADGRFVGNGGRGSEDGFGATVTDLVTNTNIGVKGSYDPGFFPDNNGFIMQGGGAGLCGQSVLTNEEAIVGGIDFTEPGCSRAEGINLYQHVAVSLDGGDYFIINSQFTSDPGSGNSDPRASFGETATMKFSPLVFSGTEWTQKTAVIVDSPFEGDSVLSPSGRMVISRVTGPEGTSVGFSVRRVESTPNAEGTYDIKTDQVVQFLCGSGAKANISFDERWAVTHHYEDGTANLYVSDLRDGRTTKVTNMPAGTKALFPHFRSDGWIYFLVTDGTKDRAVATDAILQLAKTE